MLDNFSPIIHHAKTFCTKKDPFEWLNKVSSTNESEYLCIFIKNLKRYFV